MIAVAERVCGRLPGAKFVLIGDGAMRPRIQALIHEKGLHATCTLGRLETRYSIERWAASIAAVDVALGGTS